MTTTMYRIETKDTRPIGFGFPPSYVFDEPAISSAQRFEDFMEAFPVEVSIPAGYKVLESMCGTRELYDNQGNHVSVCDDHGHPAIFIEVWQNKQGKPFPRYLRLDKIA